MDHKKSTVFDLSNNAIARTEDDFMTHRTLHICHYIILFKCTITKSYQYNNMISLIRPSKVSLRYIHMWFSIKTTVKLWVARLSLDHNITKVYFISENREEIDELSPDSRVTTFSTIKFRPTSSDNGVTWACEADHPALTNAPLRTTVLLSVLRKLVFHIFFCKPSILICGVTFFCHIW